MSRVLVIEGEPVLRDLVAEILAGSGYEALTADSLEQAARLLDREQVDLVLADEQAARLLGEAHRGPAVALAKPFTASELLSKVAAALGAGTTRVLVAEDHPAVRASLVAYLDAHADIAVVGEAENGWEAVKLARQEVPDFVLMDIRMPVMDGIEGTRMIKGLRPETRVVLLSAYEQDELIEAGLQAGAEGFLLKGASGAELVAAVREGL
jgi:DNA-binding NarL/FixJ family response regulator